LGENWVLNELSLPAEGVSSLKILGEDDRMRSREVLWIALRTAAGICAVFVSLNGLWNFYGIEFRVDTAVSVLYCLCPFSSFFVFLFVRSPKFEAGLHAAIALGYLATFSMLNWRTCASVGYCGTVVSTILLTLKTNPVLAAFAVIVLSGATVLLDMRTSSRRVESSIA
jgi:hypothetical protein